MDVSRSSFIVTVAGAAVALSGPAAARAQVPEPAAPPAFEVMASGGIAIPAGGLADITSAGPALGGSVSYRFLPHFGFRAGVGADLLDGTQDAQGNQFPSTSMVHITGGLLVDLARPDWQDSPLTTSVDVGLGITHMKTNASDVPAPVGGFSKTFFAATGGLRIGWRFDEHVEAFGEGRTYMTLGKRGDLAVLSNHSPAVGSLRDLWSFPITAGVRVTFQ